MTDPTDFRAELQALIDAAESFADPIVGHGIPWKTAMDRARAALSAAPQQPSDDDLLALADEHRNDHGLIDLHSARDYARAVLARYGGQSVPVPVAERLPGPGDCDSNGDAWFDTGADVGWMLCDSVYALRHGSRTWLPHYALPLPEAQP